MLKELTIQNYALIESLDIEFPDGLVIITGETGAGKSVLLGALSLLLGGKSDSSVFGNPERNCVVEGLFEIDNSEYIIRRVITPAGRSRFFLNDDVSTAADIAELSRNLLDIHGQNSQLLLRDKDFILKLLDSFCANSSLLEDYRAQYDKVAALKVQFEALRKEVASSNADREYLEFQFGRLNEANLQAGEMEELEEEERRLSNAESIKSSLSNVLQLLDADEFSVPQAIKESEQQIAKVAEFIPRLQELKERLTECRVEIRDIADDIKQTADKSEYSKERLDEVAERLSLLNSLLHRYSSDSIENLIAIRDEYGKRLSVAETGDEQLKNSEKELENEIARAHELADALSARRAGGTDALADAIGREMANLGMSGGECRIVLEKRGELSPSGQDEAKFLFSANYREKLIEIQKVASGGELSRVMLCIKKIMAEKSNLPTMIFDEVDAGVSGKIADKMGYVLSEMGKTMQILAITHLPQVASKGNTHLLVYKDIDQSGRAHTHIRQLSDKERIDEVARLLSGEKTSAQALENAKVLLENN